MMACMRREGVAIVALISALGSGCRGDGDGGQSTLDGGDESTSVGDGDGDGEASPLGDPQTGDPGIQSMHELDFGPAGVLVIGDGVGDRLVAVETGDTDPDDAEANAFDKIDGLSDKLAAIFGGGGVTVEDMAVNPISKRLYVAAYQASSGYYALISFDGGGNAFMFDLSDVTYASVSYPVIDTPGSIVSDIRWTDGYLVASAMKGGFTPSQLVIVPNAPFVHGATTTVSSTYSYHRSHMAWETQAPISRFAAYTHDGEPYIAASFQCTPVVRYRVADLAPGVAQAVGQTPYDLGGGKQVEDFTLVQRETDETSYLLQILSGVAGQIGVATGMSLVRQDGQIDEAAPIVLGNTGIPTHEAVVRADFIDGATRLAAYDEDHVVILRADAIERVELLF
jgi:hypothetical protein